MTLFHRSLFFSLAAVAATTVSLSGLLQAADSSLPEPPVGKDSVAGDCVVCHSLAKSGGYRSAPGLWGVVDAPKARAAWFGYSIALKKKGGDWTTEDLDRYLAGPSQFVPGTKKTMNPIADPERRQELIEYLATLKE